ncbi:MAG: peptidylprolyl isomerase [Thermoprotei archaeon]|nr:MAG: peptidylprolyl isomerase [Thermoprotei archaeon]
MTLKKGAFILMEYTVYSKDDHKIIDTTVEEKAKEGGIFNENSKYEPELVIIGEGMLFKSLEEELVKLKEGETATIELPPEKAFGKRDPSKIRIISARELSRRGIIPRVNEEVEINGQRAIIRSVGGGRVTLDFNHPLAGKTLVYNIKIVKILKEPSEKLRELVYRWLKRALSRKDIKVRVREKVITIILPIRILSVENLGIAIRGIIRDIQRYFPNVEKIIFREEYEFPRKEVERERKQDRSPKDTSKIEEESSKS